MTVNIKALYDQEMSMMDAPGKKKAMEWKKHFWDTQLQRNVQYVYKAHTEQINLNNFYALSIYLLSII